MTDAGFAEQIQAAVIQVDVFTVNQSSQFCFAWAVIGVAVFIFALDVMQEGEQFYYIGANI